MSVPPNRRSSKPWRVSTDLHTVHDGDFLSLDHREQGHRVLHDLLTGGSSLLLIDEDLNDE